VILVTKYRKAIINDGIIAYINTKLAEVTEHYPTIRFKVENHDKDLVHLLMMILSTTAVGKVMGIVK
jgi:REP element-mobilizing transposase RayT